MKILLAAPQDTTTLGFISRDCVKTFRALGHEVEAFDFRKRPYGKSKFVSGLKRSLRRVLPFLPSPYDFSPVFRQQIDHKINADLEKLAFDFQPNLILVFLGENLAAATLDHIRGFSSHPVIANWFHDTLLLDYRKQLLDSIVSAYDIIFLIDSGQISEKLVIRAKKTVVLPLGCNPLVHKRVVLSEQERKYYGSDVAFVGTLTPERQVWLEQLAGEFDLKIWGRWQTKSAKLARCYQAKDLYSEDAVKIYNASKIILDFHSLWQKQDPLYNVTPRVFEVPASGGFLLTNSCLQLKDFYSLGEEMVVYRDLEELKKLIAYYLEHADQRNQIVQKAYDRAHSEHTLEKRLISLLENVGRLSP
jgi:glycosyltransferase involved in cell wall biosynthesis